MDDTIVAAIRSRLQAGITDQGWTTRSILTPADPVEVANDERRLGFTVPPLMKRLYVEIGNGGFGPGYGLIGLTNGVPDDTGKTGPEIYNQFRCSDPNDPNWKWPSGLLPICHWGCAILSCVDCADSKFRMRIFDPNARHGDDWADSFFEEAEGFETWISEWASGVDLWKMMYGEEGRIAKILSARRTLH